MRNFTTMFRGSGSFNCSMCSTTRNQKLWGGTGNDTEFGYAGDDKVYGEEGDDDSDSSGHMLDANLVTAMQGLKASKSEACMKANIRTRDELNGKPYKSGRMSSSVWARCARGGITHTGSPTRTQTTRNTRMALWLACAI